MRVWPRYTEQFKLDAVELLKSSNTSYRKVADDLRLGRSLRNWYKRFEMSKRRKRSAKVVVAEEALDRIVANEPLEQRLARLERENAALKR